jgi:hypothetical protein|tara:strand:- start:1463 stop:1912 length:450 start_codon:yes stop_codon:yes gene_type:complete
MTERMRDAFVVRDTNGRKDMIPSQRERPMSMGDGTFMSDNAFRESVPMMSYTPEELGINMAAYPMATDTAMSIASQDRQQSGEMTTMTPRQEVTLQEGTSPYLNVVKEDEYDGGVQFNSEFLKTNSYPILMTLVIFGAGWAFANWRNNQ